MNSRRILQTGLLGLVTGALLFAYTNCGSDAALSLSSSVAGVSEKHLFILDHSTSNRQEVFLTSSGAVIVTGNDVDGERRYSMLRPYMSQLIQGGAWVAVGPHAGNGVASFFNNQQMVASVGCDSPCYTNGGTDIISSLMKARESIVNDLYLERGKNVRHRVNYQIYIAVDGPTIRNESGAVVVIRNEDCLPAIEALNNIGEDPMVRSLIGDVRIHFIYYWHDDPATTVDDVDQYHTLVQQDLAALAALTGGRYLEFSGDTPIDYSQVLQ